MKNQKYKLTSILLILALLILAVPVAAQESFSAALKPAGPADGYTVGDPILLELTVQHPAGTHLIVPDLPETWGDFTVASVSPADIVDHEDGHKTTTITIDARLFAPGEFQSPPLTVQLVDPAGQLTPVELPPVPISVQSVLVDGDSALRDIKPPVDLPAGNILMLLLGATLMGMAGTGATFWWWRHGRPTPIPVDTRPAYVVALSALDELEKQDLPAQKQIKPYYTALSDILRQFLGREYQIAIQEQTTTEINRSLQQKPLPPLLRPQYVQLLHECDLVKFADAHRSPVQAAEILATMRTVIQDSQSPVMAEAPGRAAIPPSGRNLITAPMEVTS